MPSFRQVLEGVSQAWRRDRQGVEQAGARLVQSLVDSNRTTTGNALPPASTLDDAVAGIEQQFDARYGGWGRAPKFPQPMTIEFLLRRNVATGDDRPLATARRSLDAMADGGIHDQLGGGFHRYSTTADWLVPHFEQMLYDNAQLARVYSHAWALTGDERYRATAEGTLDYLIRELRTNEGGFAASQDADTEGEEGRTFVWTKAEIAELLGDEDAAVFGDYYDVTEQGNWEGHTILQRTKPAGSEGIEARLAGLRNRLLEHRQRRPQPARDDKVLAGWNGLAIAALADAARAFDRDDYRQAAVDAASLILERLGSDSGRLQRSWKDGRASAAGVLEDHALLGEGLLALYEATFEERWFTAARDLAGTILDHFADPQGGFFDTADDAERLITRPKDPQDNAVPSGGAMATLLLLRLAALTGEGRYRDAAEKALASVGPYLGRHPTSFAQWLSALDFAHAPVAEVAIVGDPAAVATVALLESLVRPYRPHLVVAAADDPPTSRIPLLRDRMKIGDRPTAYVCRAFACRLPVTDPAALMRELEAVAAG
jgi:uncharacterized protein YyaL (SSP411 family)